MSKRTASKPARSNRKQVTKRTGRPKVTARAQRNKQVSVRSPKVVRPVAAGSRETPIEAHDELKQETSTVDNRARAVVLEAILQASLPNGLSQKMRDDNPKPNFEFSSAVAKMQAYQATLLEVAQADIQFAFDFIQRLATTKSPFEYWAVIAEFTGRRIVMIGKHSKELAACWGSTAFRELTALPRR